MTEQEVFDQSVNAILKQGEPSYLEGRCYYRHPILPLKCAVGHLLEDHEVPDEVSLNEIELPPRLEPHRKLLAKLQQAHDDAATEPFPFVENFKKKVAEICVSS